MIDLVKELRASYDPNDAVPMQVCLDAADRIERLEAALRKVLAQCSWYDAAAYDDFEETIRKALEGKDD